MRSPRGLHQKHNRPKIADATGGWYLHVDRWGDNGPGRGRGWLATFAGEVQLATGLRQFFRLAIEFLVADGGLLAGRFEFLLHHSRVERAAGNRPVRQHRDGRPLHLHEAPVDVVAPGGPPGGHPQFPRTQSAHCRGAAGIDAQLPVEHRQAEGVDRFVQQRGLRGDQHQLQRAGRSHGSGNAKRKGAGSARRGPSGGAVHQPAAILAACSAASCTPPTYMNADSGR